MEFSFDVMSCVIAFWIAVSGAVIYMVSLANIGRFGLREVYAAMVLFPGIVIGFFLSRHTARILDRGFIWNFCHPQKYLLIQIGEDGEDTSRGACAFPDQHRDDIEGCS
jgi:hypothetical protein